jgi:hypothetical protein
VTPLGLIVIWFTPPINVGRLRTQGVISAMTRFDQSLADIIARCEAMTQIGLAKARIRTINHQNPQKAK